ncbi:MAG: glutamyl-tRNA reductase [Omnitrophica bacterium GWA2_52_12]|nr:MAG: glutamyl-tRNA reductase [Omnitrophica bacterium GWA2_52_12]
MDMGIFALGLNHKECPVQVRARLHFSPAMTEAALRAMRGDAVVQEFALLSTCNRVELYGYSEKKAAPRERLLTLIESLHDIRRAEFEKYLYFYEGRDAVRHMFRVAAGLDSLVVGECEILGQFREAFRLAGQAGTVHALLYRLMEKVLKTGKDVHARTKITQGAVSIPAVAVELAEKIFGSLGGERVMVVGTGEMGVLTLKNLREAGADIAYIVSRNEERGKALAEEYGAEQLTMTDWAPALKNVDILIASTSAPEPVILHAQVAPVMAGRRDRPLFLIDIAVPRNIESQVNEIDDVYLYNVDDLKGVSASNLKLRRGELRAAEAIVETAVAQYHSWVEQLSARPTVERFERFLNQVMAKEIDVLARETGLSDDKKNQLINRLRAKLLHRPVEKIKEASQNGGVAKHLEALHSLFDLDELD